MTEHSAVIFVFFFLAEYASIVLICIFTSILFLGGYLTLFSLHSLLNIMYYLDMEWYFKYINLNIFILMFQVLVYSLSLVLKSCIIIFFFINIIFYKKKNFFLCF